MESDPNPLGVYVVVLCQDEKRFFYYCNLSKLRVGLGEVVDKGEVLGWVGRTGHDTVSKNLGTHLRFQVFSFDDGLFYPVFPGRALKEAKQLPWPLPEPEYNKIPKQRYEIERLPDHPKISDP
jgi:murein DD-endopeptidase MepM/ murein hydrolase activator NlpD